jgi:hypothetical protein
MISFALLRSLFVIFALTVAGSSSATPASESGLLDWILPKICVDGGNKPVSADPYRGCPAGTKTRPIASGDPLPYRKLDNAKQQYKDIYPRVGADGTDYAVVSFDWLDPKNDGASRFKVWADGYDAYVTKDGWASGSETRIGTGEYATTFFGAGCRNYGGLLFFPASFLASLQSPGSTKPSIGTSAWEEDNQAYPGNCPTRYGNDQVFTWGLIRNFPFAGIGGAPAKPLDTIVTTMGLRTTKDPQAMAKWMAYGHLEVFYFTKIYGLTRWESWVPNIQLEHDGREPAAKMQERAATAGKICSAGPSMTSVPFVLQAGQAKAARFQMTYQGLAFTMSDCRDWTNIVLQNPPVQPPAWPVSGLNLLRNFHFNGAAIKQLPNWDTSHLSHGELVVSKTKDDTTHDSPAPLGGIAYLRLGCSGGCDSESIHQDIPVSALTRSGSYTLGVIARTEAGTGSLKLSLAQMNGDGIDLSKATFTAHNLTSEERGCDNAGEHCRKFAFDPKAKTGSVVLSSNFVSETLPISIDPRARKLRFEIDPASANDFDLVSAWVMCSP